MIETKEFYQKKLMENSTPEPNTGCWLWTRSLNNKGYGVASFKHKERIYAHRLSYMVFVGDIEKSNVIMHKCDTPACINPDHLKQGTMRDNTSDMMNKKRHGTANKTHCRNGHEFTKENTIYWGQRVCRECNKKSREKYYELRRRRRASKGIT